MASTNPLEQDLLDLFPDNLNQEISAEDMRTYVSSIMSHKEELIVKLNSASDIPSNNSNIWEKSIVIIDSSDDASGIYISDVNNPVSIVQCTKIADLYSSEDLVGYIKSDGSIPMDTGYNPSTPLDVATKEFVESTTGGAIFPPDSVESFMLIYNEYKVSSEAEYSYDAEGNILTILIVNSSGDILYTVDISYLSNGDIDTKTITDINNVYATIKFNYTNDIISSKDITLHTP